MLSGFLVSSACCFREFQQTGQIWLGRSFVRRGLRIYPALYLFLRCVRPVRMVVRWGLLACVHPLRRAPASVGACPTPSARGTCSQKAFNQFRSTLHRSTGFGRVRGLRVVRRDCRCRDGQADRAANTQNGTVLFLRENDCRQRFECRSCVGSDNQTERVVKV